MTFIFLKKLIDEKKNSDIQQTTKQTIITPPHQQTTKQTVITLPPQYYPQTVITPPHYPQNLVTPPHKPIKFPSVPKTVPQQQQQQQQKQKQKQQQQQRQQQLNSKQSSNVKKQKQFVKQRSFNDSNVESKIEVSKFKSINVLSLSGKEIIEEILKHLPKVIPLLQVGNINSLGNSFDNHTSYKEYFVPHCVQEFIASFSKDIDDAEDFVTGTLYSQKGNGIYTTINFMVKDLSNNIFKKNDLILFKPLNKTAQKESTSPCLVGIFHGTIGVGDQKMLNCRFFDSEYTTPVLETMFQNQILNQQISLKQVSNCDPFYRELSRLYNIKKSPLFSLICSPKSFNQSITKMHDLPISIEKDFANKLNESQMRAIKQSLNVTGITLIQGPPGTGKTTTIHSIISMLLAINPFCKIMVCAPSHTAVDEIAKRVISKQLTDKYGNTYSPEMVRIGKEEKISPEVHSISAFKCGTKFFKSGICFSTLGGSSSMVGSKFQADVVIVDESTQSTEISTILPLTEGVKKLILVGDTKQLPPTILSDRCSGLKKSLFERLSTEIPTVMLDTQYRMHPSISKFSMNQFYKGQLKDGCNVKSEAYNQPFHKEYPPISFYDITDSREESLLKSKKNRSEVNLIFTLIKKLVQDFPECASYSFGIISPYKLQRNEIEQFEKKHFNYKLDITCNTVDGFQGGEKDIIFYSCVRTNSIGFLSDLNRINVGITRAKYGMFIIGNKNLLSRDPTWCEYISKCSYKPINSVGIRNLGTQAKNYDLLNPKGLVPTLSKDKKEDQTPINHFDDPY